MAIKAAKPAKPSSPISSSLPMMRNKEIAEREHAIQRRLDKANRFSKAKATAKVAKETAKRKGKGSGIVRTYKTQYIKDEKQGFTDSDYGVGKGAAIPYQIGEKTNVIARPQDKEAGLKWGSGAPKLSRPDNPISRAADNARANAVLRRAAKNKVKGL